jgi:hypothetical protein
MITIRRSHERGHLNHGWLDARHTFSFGRYLDRAHMGFRALRVINEDVVAPARGFSPHEHDNMEIVTYPLSGSLRHTDSLGHREDIAHPMIQRMTAGSGITHGEANASTTDPVHLLQIWLLPDAADLPPGHETVRTPVVDEPGRLHLIASQDGRGGSMRLRAAADLYAGRFFRGDSARLELAPGRHAWVQVARGAVRVGDQTLRAGDAAAISDEAMVDLRFDAADDGAVSEVLVFDLA